MPTSLPTTTAFTAQGRKILVVDEEAKDWNSLRPFLELHGMDVSTCTAYDAGIRCLERETYDFVVVGQGTHAFEGRRVVERAMELSRSRPVLVVTRCLDMACYLEAMQMGAIDYLEKPIPPADLLRFVLAHLEYERLVKQSSAA